MQQVVSIQQEQATQPAPVCSRSPRAIQQPIDPRRRQRDGGYLLLAILLTMALMIIAATVQAPRVVQQIKRDREEEMIHRGTEYARAIKKFYKKFGRYPANLEQLDNTNQIRFLRKRYKDPLTKDGKWKVLTYGDIQTLPTSNTPGTPAAALGAQGQGAFGRSSAESSVGGDPVGTGQQPSVLTPSNIVSTSTTGSDQSTPTSGQQVTGTAGNLAGNSLQGNAQQGNNPIANTFSLGSTSASTSNQQGSTALGANQTGGNQTFGGGAIVGVASLSKDPTIRIYNKKRTYNEWQFIYNPVTDQPNVLLRGPYQPTIIGGAQVGTPAGQMNSSGQGSFGQQQTGFGQQPSGFGQQQNSPQQTPAVNQFPPDQNQQH